MMSKHKRNEPSVEILPPPLFDALVNDYYRVLNEDPEFVEALQALWNKVRADWLDYEAIPDHIRWISDFATRWKLPNSGESRKEQVASLQERLSLQETSPPLERRQLALFLLFLKSLTPVERARFLSELDFTLFRLSELIHPAQAVGHFDCFATLNMACVSDTPPTQLLHFQISEALEPDSIGEALGFPPPPIPPYYPFLETREEYRKRVEDVMQEYYALCEEKASSLSLNHRKWPDLLSEEYRKRVVRQVYLNVLKEKPAREIAREANLSESTVRNSIRRALRILGIERSECVKSPSPLDSSHPSEDTL